mmetsp:Transcript_84081/g.243045  ORF Transcript_84081/g.243045 Transcript_84081/m.243045 type:complete len:295 (+) Transcript_84081:672-1556(+)
MRGVVILVAGLVVSPGSASTGGGTLLHEGGCGGWQLRRPHQRRGGALVLLWLQREHLVAHCVLVVLAGLLVLRVFRLGEEILPLRQGLLNVGEPSKHMLACCLRSGLATENPVLLLDRLQNGLDDLLAILEDLDLLLSLVPIILRRGRSAGNLRLQVAEGLVAVRLIFQLQPVLRLLLIVEFAVLLVEALDFTVQGIDIGEQGKVPLLELHEDLHNLLNVRNPCGRLDRRKGLLEDFDILFVLLDVPPLDRVEKGQLEDPSHHRRRVEKLLLVSLKAFGLALLLLLALIERFLD